MLGDRIAPGKDEPRKEWTDAVVIKPWLYANFIAQGEKCDVIAAHADVLLTEEAEQLVVTAGVWVSDEGHEVCHALGPLHNSSALDERAESLADSAGWREDLHRRKELSGSPAIHCGKKRTGNDADGAEGRRFHPKWKSGARAVCNLGIP